MREVRTIGLVGMSPAELVARAAARQPSTILDVRSRAEFARGRVPGAVHAPFWRVERLMEQVGAGPAGAPVVVYCGHGPRAWWAALRLRQKGVTEVHCLSGHMAGWRRAGMEEERS